MASLAQFESQLIGERVKAGMQRVRAQGKIVSQGMVPGRRLMAAIAMGHQVENLRGS